MKESEAKEKACAWGVAPKCLARGCMAWLPSWRDALPGTHLTSQRPGYLPLVVPDNPERDVGFCSKVAEIDNKLMRGF